MTARRLHVLSGVVPLGVFLLEHLVVMASAMGGQGRFAAVTGDPTTTVRAGIDVLVLGALLFHGGYGVFLLLNEKAHAEDDPLRRRGMRILVRVASFVTLLFVVGHLWALRLHPPSDAYTLLTERLSSTAFGIPWVALGYVLGCAATIFHFAYGLVSAPDRWGSPLGEAGRRRALAMSLVIGVALFLVSTATVVSIATGSRLLSAEDPGMTRPCGSAASSALAAPSASPDAAGGGR